MMKSTYIKTKAFVFFFLISTFVVINAQESVEQFTQYTYNATTINPAFAGARGVTSIFGSYRTQWVGVPGAPQTIMVSANGATRSKNIGLGISFLNDNIGPSDQNTISLDFAYSIKINTDYKLAFGVKATGNLINVNFKKLDIRNPEDLSYENNIDNKFSPNVGFGFDLHSDKTSVSLSIPNLLKTSFYDKYSSNTNNSKIATENLNVFITADHIFELSPDLIMKPAILLKVGPNQLGGGVQTYISDTFGFYERFNLGISYRFRGTISALAGFQITNGIFIGYGYDLETRMMNTYSTASHEIFMRFDFAVRKNNNKKKK